MTQGASQDPDDIDRLIQETLAELGHSADPAEVARRVRGLDRGLPAEDEFSVMCGWLGQTRLIHKLDQLQTPVSSRETYQVPDVLAAFQKAGPFLIEIKVSKHRTLSFRPDYLRKLTDYAELLGHPLLIAWKYHSVWCLFDARHLQLARLNFNITHSQAMRQNLLGVLAGDLGYALGSGAGVHFDCAKEELISTEGDEERFTELWQMRISDVFFTDGEGRRRDDLHAETKQIFAGWDLQTREEHFPDRIQMSFVPGESQMQFAHTALVQLLAWERPIGSAQNWRHLLRATTVTRSLGNFEQALTRALAEGVVHHIIHQQPVVWPDFLPRDPSALAIVGAVGG